jgi:hypothetical protein
LKRNFINHIAMGLALLAFPFLNASAQTKYTVSDLGLGRVFSINSAGDVIGQIGVINTFDGGLDFTTSYVYASRSGKRRALDATFEAVSINNSGDILGYNSGTPVIYKSGKYTTLTFPANSSPDLQDLNNSDQVVGEYHTGEYLVSTAFSYGSGVLTNLPSLAGRDGTGYATGVNSRGEIVGFSFAILSPMLMPPDDVAQAVHATVYTNGRLLDLQGFPPNAAYKCSFGLAINEHGHAVGYGLVQVNPEDIDVSHAFLWTGSGPIRDLGTLPNNNTSVAVAINNSDVVVGNCFNYGEGTITLILSTM